MIIKPSIRMNVSFTAHPLGLKKHIEEQAQYLLSQPKINGPKNVVIIGGSTGYGLATKLALGLCANSNILTISFETPPDNKRTGSAGFWNNIFSTKLLREHGISCIDFIGDAFSDKMKEQVIAYIKEYFDGKVDMLVYSLASSRRTDPKTNITHNSTLKVIGDVLTGYSIDMNTQALIERSIEPATEENIQETIKVMGGEDWKLWIEKLSHANVLNKNFKTITYSYIGPQATERIYRSGTIGKAKEHMEKTAEELNDYLIQKVDGTAVTAVCRAAITRASSVIPIFPLYGSALIRVMTEKGIEELPHEHIYRLYHDMVYGNKPEYDNKRRLRPDAWELREDVQTEVEKLMKQVTKENYQNLLSIDTMQKIFLQQNGFGFTNIDYSVDINLEELMKQNEDTFLFI